VGRVGPDDAGFAGKETEMLRKAKFAAVLATAGALVISGQPAHAAPADDAFGCPSRWVCIYRDSDNMHLNGAYITYRWSTYGAHNLVNQIGHHWVVNYQYGGPNATAVLRTGYNGTGSVYATLAPTGSAYGYDLTPVNSVVLNHP
jgi:hypothetical protein